MSYLKVDFRITRRIYVFSLILLFNFIFGKYLKKKKIFNFYNKF